MKKISIISIIIFSSYFFLGCEKQLNELGLKSSVKRTIMHINSSYKGVVIDKYAPRKNMNPTHIKIIVHVDTITISPNEEIIDYISLGDSIIKQKDENLVYIKTNDGKKKEFYYILISKRVRMDKSFPKEWKDKWLESTLD